MKTLNKKKYIVPKIEVICLDNEISLALESNPPVGPTESIKLSAHEYFTNNPFDKELG
jgi:hypothetical protein